MRKTIVFFGAVFITLAFGLSWAASPAVLTISGQVVKPLQVNLEDFKKMPSITVRLNELDQGKNFRGTFNYQGVPLRTLLEQAHIQKGKSDFNKLIDLAVVVRNKEGRQIVLSWGEIFYRNPAEITIAFSGVPIMPHKKCDSCHKPEVYGRWFNQLTRPVGFPKLIAANDFYTDRSLENITGIEVIDLPPGIKGQKMAKLHSPSFAVSGQVKNPLVVTDLTAYPHTEMLLKQVGDGMGFHGLKWAEGVPLIDILKKAGAEMDLTTVILISAPDGYRSLLSYGELMLTPAGGRILIADKINHNPLDKDGKFF
ncbi:MAG: hypothetical protein V2B13_13920, partial [Pseudomonadota bacterium]